MTGILFQGDSFGWYTVVGMIMIIAGVIACNMPTEEDNKDNNSEDDDHKIK